MHSLAKDTQVQATSSHTYTANFPAHWCIGNVPHGGFVTSCFQQVADLHFKTTLSKQNQPHNMTMHLSFLRRTEVGPATFKVVDSKLGLRTSIIHITLIQQNREEVVAYITNTNLSEESGPSFPTSFTLTPPSPKVDLHLLEAGKDANWAESEMQPFTEFRKAVSNVRFFFPRQGQTHASTMDQWLRFTSGERFTNESLGFVVDMFPQMIENYRFPGKDPYAADMSRRPDQKEHTTAVRQAPFWYPTVLLNLDVKKALPERGVEWLFARTSAKQIKNGRYDVEVLVYDGEGDLVAISNHVVLVVEAARNLAKRKDTPQKGKL